MSQVQRDVVQALSHVHREMVVGLVETGSVAFQGGYEAIEKARQAHGGKGAP